MKLALVLMRFAGFRCATELNALALADIDWEREVIKVYDTKRKQTRLVPIFPEIKPYLYTACENAPEGAVKVLPHKTNRGYRYKFLLGGNAILKRSGLPQWENFFNNLRKSAVVDLKTKYPGFAVEDWVGHTSGVSREWYTEVNDNHFAMVKNAESSLPSQASNVPQSLSQELTEDIQSDLTN